MPAPWTQSLTLDWRPELRFYEKRFEILRHFEEEGSMWAFRASENLAEARLIDQWHQVSIKQNRASMHLLSPTASANDSWDALAFAVDTIKPRYPLAMAAAFQYVAPLDLSFEAAVARGHQGLLACVDVEGVKPADWAVLLDLTLDGLPDAHGQTEFGIVRSDEVAGRLSRTDGRTNLAESPTVSPNLWASEEFPAVALFADVTFRKAINTVDAGLAELQIVWESARDRAGRLVEALKAQLVADDTSKEVAS